MATAPSSPDRLMLLAFAAVVASFIASTAYSQHSEASIGQDALAISGTLTPKIEHLARARAVLSQLTALMRERREAATPGQPPRLTQFAVLRAQIDAELMQYMAQPALPGEQQVRADIRAGLKDLDDAQSNLLSRPPESPPRLLPAVRPPGAQRITAAVLQGIDLNARRAQDLAGHIKNQRRLSQRVAYVLNGLSAGLSMAAAWLALLASRRHRGLLQAHGRLLQARADELEQFAGRVAHDIRGPLSAIALSLHHAQRSPSLDAALRPTLDRGAASLQRAERIIAGLLEFARAGAQKDDGARCDVGEVLEDVMSEVRPVAAEAAVILHAETFAACTVRCGPAILTSLLSNLLHNAIKYMGDRPVRRVTVRVLDQDAAIAVEVEDTGVGLPPELLGAVFQPYVRAARATEPGIGLGLATVKRLAEAYGGEVGVRSQAGQGSVFWFRLPRFARA